MDKIINKNGKISPSHWLLNTRRLPSANCTPRSCISPTLLVIHNISLPPKQFNPKDIQDFFTNKLDTSKHDYYQQLAGMKVSAHLLIERNGTITQFVPFNLAAWHAGKSAFLSQSQCNDFSIGIELEGSDTIPFNPAQYQSLIQAAKAITQRYPISPNRIMGHSDIAPIRKTDPGIAFDWRYFLSQLH